jgi:hypothetical protein
MLISGWQLKKSAKMILKEITHNHIIIQQITYFLFQFYTFVSVIRNPVCRISAL